MPVRRSFEAVRDWPEGPIPCGPPQAFVVSRGRHVFVPATGNTLVLAVKFFQERKIRETCRRRNACGFERVFGVHSQFLDYFATIWVGDKAVQP